MATVGERLKHLQAGMSLFAAGMREMACGCELLISQMKKLQARVEALERERDLRTQRDLREGRVALWEPEGEG